MKKNAQGQRFLIVVLVLIILLAAFFIVLPNLSTTNLFQGQQAGVVGIQIQGGSTIGLGSKVSQTQCFEGESDPYVGTAWPATCTFKWISSSSVSPTIYADANLPPLWNDQVQVDYSVGNFVSLCSADNLISASGSQCAAVTYQNSGGQKFTGYIVPYQFSVDISVASTSGTHISFRGITFVNEILNFLWNNIPAGYQTVNQSTIYASVTSCTLQVGSGSQNCATANLQYANVNPMAAGSQVGLYSDPNLQNSIGSCVTGNCLPSANNPFPSSYMNSAPTYFGITLSSFGAYACGSFGASQCYPSVHLVINAQTFLVGTYIKSSVNPVTQTQSSLGGGNNKAINPLNWLNNPFNQAIIEIIIILIVVGIVAIAIITVASRLPKR